MFTPHRIWKVLVLPFLSFMLVVGLSSLVWAEKPKELRVVIIPVVKPEEFAKAHQLLASYLEKRLNIKVKVTVPAKYEEAVDAIVKGTADLAYLGGLTYIQAKKQAPGIQPIVAAIPNKHYTVMITKAESGIKSISDLKGKGCAFGSEGSTSGHLIPRGYMLAIKFDPAKDCSKMVFTGGHDKTAMAVANGEIDAGALYEPVYEKMAAEGKISKDKVVVFWKSPPFADYPWVVRAGLDPAFVKTLQKAFVDLKDKAVMEPLKIEGYTEITDDAFKIIEAYVDRLGFVK